LNKLAIVALVAGLVGFSLLVTGIALIHIPSAFITAGFGLIGWSWLADKAAARIPIKRNPEGG